MSPSMIHTVGHCDQKVFGLSPAQRLERQCIKLDALIVADASAILDDNALRWLVDQPGTVLETAGGRRLAVAVVGGDPGSGIRALSGSSETSVVTPAQIGERFVRKLRRRSLPLAISLHDIPAPQAERMLFASVYKGVTDLVTKWLWPVPAFIVTRIAAQLGILPNLVTSISFILTVIAGWLFFEGNISSGLAAAWSMTFLDTVDGKLARVTVTSSRIGNWLDHGIDVIHPPLWWLCLAQGLATYHADYSASIWAACAVILAAYVLGRAVEVSFHIFFGFNGYLLTPLDAAFRLIVARRNVLLLILTVGTLVGESVAAFIVCAAWSATSTLMQGIRLSQALIRSSKGVLKPYLL
jgi:phosphatidylglycerophosphate synthase